MRVKALIVVTAALLASLVESSLSWLVTAGACALVYRLPEETPRLTLLEAGRATHTISKIDPKLVAGLMGAVYGMCWIVGYAAITEY